MTIQDGQECSFLKELQNMLKFNQQFLLNHSIEFNLRIRLTRLFCRKTKVIRATEAEGLLKSKKIAIFVNDSDSDSMIARFDRQFGDL